MRRLHFTAIALISFFALIQRSATAEIENLQPQQVAQAGEECHGQQILRAASCTGDGIEPEEARLYQLLNQYRAGYGLPPIPLSKSLTLVANRHVRDVEENNFPPGSHSWSNCPFTLDSSTYPCMWTAPQRLGTAYPGSGYEIANGYGDAITAEQALKLWMKSPPHNAVILNQGNWQKHWNAVGVGIYRGRVGVWFGYEPDPANTTE